ncbi:MAG: hypothetical protein ACT4QF_25485 [Sporichthyaceae bacterium]
MSFPEQIEPTREKGEARERIVALLVESFGIQSEDVEDLMMPSLDHAVRAVWGHELWREWVA